MLIFKRIFISLALFFTLLVNNVYPEVVKKIEVVGNERISNETIVIFGPCMITTLI